MLTYDPRYISRQVFRKLQGLKNQVAQDTNAQKKQKGQALELYNYLATWGLLRLRAEELTLKKEPHKRSVIIAFFEVLEEIGLRENPAALGTDAGFNVAGNEAVLQRVSLEWLSSSDLPTSEYLGLTGLGLRIAREFAFWAEAVYPDLDPAN